LQPKSAIKGGSLALVVFDVSFEPRPQVELCQRGGEDSAAAHWAPRRPAVDTWTAGAGLWHECSYVGVLSYDPVWFVCDGL